jgi:hypothetical protein
MVDMSGGRQGADTAIDVRSQWVVTRNSSGEAGRVAELPGVTVSSSTPSRRPVAQDATRAATRAAAQSPIATRNPCAARPVVALPCRHVGCERPVAPTSSRTESPRWTVARGAGTIAPWAGVPALAHGITARQHAART